jgi:hypothetical protein
MKNMKPVIPVILILIGLGVGFFGGFEYRTYQLNKARVGFTGANGGFQRFNGALGARGNNQNGGFRGGAINGSILSMDSNSITVKLNDGSTKIVVLSGSTTYSNTTSALVTDLKTGINVAVFGTPNSDGSVTATIVQLNPMMFRPQASALPKAQ